MPRSLQQQIASRANGSSGGRPPGPLDPHGQAAVRRIKERARKLGGASLAHCVRYMIQLVNDPSARSVDRLRAAESLCDRFGLPRLETIANLTDAFEIPKLIVRSHFEPPPGWNGLREQESPVLSGAAELAESPVDVSAQAREAPEEMPLPEEAPVSVTPGG